MNFIDFNQLYHDVQRLARKVPEVDAVLGVPRSGMLPAAMFASIRNIPLGCADPYILFGHGVRRVNERPVRNVLILDDSYSKGASMDGVRSVPAPFEKAYFAAVYSSDPEPNLDFFGKLLPEPRLFAWNMLNNGDLPHMAVDFDGVLCHDPDGPCGDVPSLVREHAKAAQPRHKPLYKVGAIVTGRIKEVEPETLAWLEKHGYDVGDVYHYDGPEKTAKYNAAHFKAAKYIEGRYKLYIESNDNEAQDIARLSGKPVLCTDTLKLYDNH